MCVHVRGANVNAIKDMARRMQVHRTCKEDQRQERRREGGKGNEGKGKEHE